MNHLEKALIETRPIIAGNMAEQPNHYTHSSQNSRRTTELSDDHATIILLRQP